MKLQQAPYIAVIMIFTNQALSMLSRISFREVTPGGIFNRGY